MFEMECVPDINGSCFDSLFHVIYGVHLLLCSLKIAKIMSQCNIRKCYHEKSACTMTMPAWSCHNMPLQRAGIWVFAILRGKGARGKILCMYMNMNCVEQYIHY